MTHLRNGHAPGHVRDCFLAAIPTFMEWKRGEPEPTVEFEIGYEPHLIPISRACGMLWNCSDTIPAYEFQELRVGAGLVIGRQTYASCARAMHQAMRYRAAA